MEFLQGVKITVRYDEMSPLDRAIDGYYKKARKYFADLNVAEKAAPDVRAKRKIELDNVRKHLEHERRLMENIVDVQAQLELYREYGRGSVHKAGVDRATSDQRLTELLAEEHHPTAILAKFMRAVPIPKPSTNHTAHHISPGKGKTRHAYRAPMMLHVLGIRINDPDNGVWLLSKTKHAPHWSMPDSLGHLQYHTEGYEKWVADKLRRVSGEEFARMQLKLIGLALQQNKLPPEARKKV